ncbi:MAG: DUF933 domain-containing protein [Candidatus Shikimatogenerans bostrichidophilus]|nr:MAG: DUF933 domain-containing protein [Candidatus Shikimatogenerans bostrichidophilus]
MECGIIGLPNVGKSTFFKLLSNKKVLIKNYPFSTINPNKYLIYLYDIRLINLCKILNIKNYKFNNIEIIDIAGIIKKSYKGKGLGNMFLSYIRNTKILINIIRFFYKKKIININNNIIDPIYEKKIIYNELLMKDISILNKFIKKNKNNNNINKFKKILYFFKKKNIKYIKKICNDEYKLIKKFNFLSLKPIIYICNINNKTNKDEILYIKKKFKKKKEIVFFLNIKKLLKKKKKVNKIINILFKKLKYITFFTIDKKNNKICSWKIKKNSYAYEASKKIHSTFSKKIIKVKVINYNKLINNKINNNNINNFYLIKSKKYIVKDGDILLFILNK